MKDYYRNTRIIAKNANEYGFDVYLDFSGRREYLVHCRKNHALWSLLKNRPYVDALRRNWMHGNEVKYFRKYQGTRHRQINGRQFRLNQREHVVTHLLGIIDCYIQEKQNCCPLIKAM